MANLSELTNTIRLSNMTSKSLLGATFSQAVYPNTNGAAFTPPVGFAMVDIPASAFTQLSAGFHAQAYVNAKQAPKAPPVPSAAAPIAPPPWPLWATTRFAPPTLAATAKHFIRCCDWLGRASFKHLNLAVAWRFAAHDALL